jgi:hypothetical protein
MGLNLPVARGQITDSLTHAISEGKHGLGVVPGLLRQALRHRAWEECVIKCTGRRFSGFPDFPSYVKAPPPEGLGASIELVRSIIRNDAEAVDLLDRALQGKHGGDRKSKNRIKSYNVTLDYKSSRGNSSAYAMRRLRQSWPDLHRKVLTGEMSANAAAVKAGLRNQQPFEQVKRLIEKLTARERREVLRILIGKLNKAERFEFLRLIEADRIMLLTKREKRALATV